MIQFNLLYDKIIMDRDLTWDILIDEWCLFQKTCFFHPWPCGSHDRERQEGKIVPGEMENMEIKKPLDNDSSGRKPAGGQVPGEGPTRARRLGCVGRPGLLMGWRMIQRLKGWILGLYWCHCGLGCVDGAVGERFQVLG